MGKSAAEKENGINRSPDKRNNATFKDRKFFSMIRPQSLTEKY